MGTRLVLTTGEKEARTPDSLPPCVWGSPSRHRWRAHSHPLDSAEMNAGQGTAPEGACAEGALKCWTSNNPDESSDYVPVNQRHGSSGDKCTSFEESYESLMFHKESEKNNTLKCMLLKMQVQLC